MNQFKRSIHKLFHIFGKDIIPYTFDNFVSLRREIILSRQKISLVLDIGANKGTYAQEIRASKFTGRIVSFEPLSSPFNQLKHKTLKDILWSCEKIAIGSTDGETSMNVSGHETSSSLLSITNTHINAMPSSATIGKEDIQVARLDSFYSKYVNSNDRIYMKIDVQGYEKEAIKGATKILEKTHVLEVELSTIPMYESAPAIIEMFATLEKMGYTLASIVPVFSDATTGHMLQADGIFVRQS